MRRKETAIFSVFTVPRGRLSHKMSILTESADGDHDSARDSSDNFRLFHPNHRDSSS